MKILFIILFYSYLFSQELIFPKQEYIYQYQSIDKELNYFQKQKESRFDFNIKLDFKYKDFQTHNISLNSFEEQKPEVPKTADPLEFEITGLYFEFKTIF